MSDFFEGLFGNALIFLVIFFFLMMRFASRNPSAAGGLAKLFAGIFFRK